jgi:hypothetical protein
MSVWGWGWTRNRAWVGCARTHTLTLTLRHTNTSTRSGRKAIEEKQDAGAWGHGHLEILELGGVLLMPPRLADKEWVVGPVAVEGLGAVEHFVALRSGVHAKLRGARPKLLRPPHLGAVNPVEKIAQEVGLPCEHVVLVVFVQDAGPVGAPRIVP